MFCLLQLRKAAQSGDVQELDYCIIDLGANVDEQNDDGDTALMLAANNGHKAAVEFLIARRANVNLVNCDGHFALYYAAFIGHKDVCEALLKAGADKTLKYNEKTAAQWASEEGHKQLAAFIESWTPASAASVCFFVLFVLNCFSAGFGSETC